MAAAAFLVLAALIPLRAWLAGANTRSSSSHEAERNELVVVAPGHRLVFDLRPYTRRGRVREQPLARVMARRLPARTVVRKGAATIVYRYEVQGTLRRARALGPAGGSVRAVRTPVSSRIALPVLGQRLRNDCEVTALQIAMAGEGVRATQERLQSQLDTSGPLDPVDGPSGRVWGDPDEGFVGRPDGGGTAGGFGVYPAPLRKLAKRYRVDMDDVTGASPSGIYARVLSGRPVIAWVGLSDGPYATWSSPEGRRVDVNFGEHTVVLAGIGADSSIRVVNPLQGTLESWSPSKFERMWALLGRRALAT